MELKSLVLGLLFSLGIFAVKTAAGLSCLFKQQNWRGRFYTACVFSCGYGVVFFCAYLLVVKVDFVAHLDMLLPVFKHGMTLHFTFAVALMLWGTTLLKSSQAVADQSSRGWLLLVVPCPVCFSVVLFSSAFLHNLFSGQDYLLFSLAAGFIAVALVGAVLMTTVVGTNQNYFVGTIMLLCASYFLLTIAIVPQFAQLQHIYHLTQVVVPAQHSTSSTFFISSFAALFMAGFWRAARR